MATSLSLPLHDLLPASGNDSGNDSEDDQLLLFKRLTLPSGTSCADLPEGFAVVKISVGETSIMVLTKLGKVVMRSLLYGLFDCIVLGKHFDKLEMSNLVYSKMSTEGSSNRKAVQTASGGQTSASKYDTVRQFLLEVCPHLEAEFDKIVATTLTMPEDGVVPLRTCNCNPPGFFTLTTVWDDSIHMGRRIFSCAKRNGMDGGYIYFLHEPIPTAAADVISFLVDRVRELAAANIIVKNKVPVTEEAKRQLAATVSGAGPKRWTHAELDELLAETQVTVADIVNKSNKFGR